ncbi:MAG: hypothetical protein GX429_01295 [Bacteroidales bacterium]|nr:hypothetical protein [Bacteroidales bacterium]
MNKIRDAQEGYFRYLYNEFAGTPKAVSSESLAHKKLRYAQLSRIFEGNDNFSIHDIGMGLAAYLDYLNENLSNLNFKYSGSEILSEYIEQVKGRFPENEFYLRDVSEMLPEDRYDYVVMSGVFHQRRETSIPEWETFSQNLISNAFKMSKIGVGFNFISPFVDFYQTEVYYCNMVKLIHFIHDKLSRFFVINHNYALFEFTVFVYQESYIKSKYTQAEFQKYFKME